MPKITKRTVDAASPDGGRRTYIWDSAIGGFGLQILPSGVKSYVFQYRSPDGKTRRATLGKHGALTPDEARKKAEDWRRAVAAGRDPLAEKAERRHAKTVGDVLDAYVRSEAFAGKADSTQAIDRGRLERHIRPLLGRAKIDGLRPGEIEKAHRAIVEGRTAADEKTGLRGRAIVRGGEGTAKKAIKLLRAALQWAVREGIIEKNPADGIKTRPDGTRDTIVADADSYGRLFRTLDQMEEERRLRQPVADAIRLIALTGARRGEITGMRWRHVDLAKGLVTLPPATHKTGRKTGQPRVIGLPAAAQAIIARQPEGAPDDYVFPPARGDGGPVNVSTPWRRVREEAGLPDGIGLHGLRHSLASHMAMHGAQASEIMTALGHRDITMAAKYVHWAKDARQALAEKAASVALAGMAGESAEVVPLRGRRDV